MSNREKGRWVACLTVAIVTVTWMAAANREGASAFLLAGLFVGVPYALVTGGILGDIAGRLDHHRELVLVLLALLTAGALDALPCLLIHDDDMFRDPVVPALGVLSLVPSVGAALWLERWTRPTPGVAPATARRTR